MYTEFLNYLYSNLIIYVYTLLLIYTFFYFIDVSIGSSSF